MAKKEHVGSSLDDFLNEEGVQAEVTARALKRVLAWQISQAMQREGLTRAGLAARMGTSRASLNRLLDPANASVTLATMGKAAAALGKRLQVELVD
ncbi:XRE family transcriptional regulator [Desulfovibrio sp. X2]|uniref:helix-turn-helix domain-containing protein n=1 Tax=Desulfovibrio sp. X2 TaxID=941449 RepID=UPI00055838A1|nr:XRE family transcriptional regulator [Desulfovibrio sp. X2]